MPAVSVKSPQIQGTSLHTRSSIKLRTTITCQRKTQRVYINGLDCMKSVDDVLWSLGDVVMGGQSQLRKAVHLQLPLEHRHECFRRETKLPRILQVFLFQSREPSE